jgi:uracil-DNA glycosylase
MLETVNLQEVKDKLYEKMKASGWGQYLRTFMTSSDMEKILERLLHEAKDNKRFTPTIKDIFRAFHECPFDKVNVVFIGQDPYPQMGVADGLAFSCSYRKKVELSLKYMNDSIKETYDPNYDTDRNDLLPWTKQGVLLLNSAFTTTIGKPGTHQLLWRPFLVSVIDALIWNNPNLIYVFIGKQAQQYADLIPDSNYKIMVSHPASVAYSSLAKWDCENLWSRVNEYLEKQNKPKIIW